ncbi:hypothetical protein FGK63_00660 [Ruegeria sediminis]|uniref:Glycerol-3-phosphate dehydrogenase n=1 Tax=Ruegeria sediminis TaxID=2583820 RepID=A0ABY2X3F4_9RHOB|nr:hypothetical protein [Ruegeria sediminis]TMV09613.1 hypothetical protein FGK63_00660 [Ruegeria sediminis]
MLTPALRISEPAEDAGSADAKPEKSQLEPEASSAQGDKDADDADGPSGVMLLRPDYAVKPDEASAPASEPNDSDARAQEPAEENWTGKSKIGPLQEELADSLSAKIEALETAIAETEDQWEPDGDSDDEYSGTRVRRITLRLHEEPTDRETEQSASGGDPMEQDEATGASQEDASSETLGGVTAQFVHVPAHEIYSKPAQEDSEEDPKTGMAAAEAKETEPDPDETALDEEALRILVADIVREELQGALGERITRNVRKLVRREILNALATRDLK